MAVMSTTGYDRRAFLVGMPIAHSISPVLHQTLYSSIGKNWGQVVIESSDLLGHLKKMRSDPTCMGSGVTMPHKVAVIPLLDELTAEGKAIGAINTIFFKPGPNGRTNFVGTNTDCIGIGDAFLNNVSENIYRGRPGLVVGGGGTCRAAVYALQNFLGCSPIYIINRDKAEVDAVVSECAARGMSASELIHVSSVAQAESLESPGAIVSAIPNFAPSTDAEKVVRQILTIFLTSSRKGAILEMCYHPSPITHISELADINGWQVMLGTEALIGQGLEQAKLWTGIQITNEMKKAVRVAVNGALVQMHRS